MSRLVTGDEIAELLQELYGTPEAIICIWYTDEPPVLEYTEDAHGHSSAEVEDVDAIKVYIADDIQSLLFVDEIKRGTWNRVVLCAESEERPQVGWMMASDIERVFIKEMPINIKTSY